MSSRPEPVSSASFTVEHVSEAKGATTVAVVLPARNEEATIGAIVEVLQRRLVDAGVVDELLVMDDGSTDRTAEVAREAGAQVISTTEIAPELNLGPGKGEALWKSLLVSNSDIVCWCDADVVGFDGSYVLGLVGALLEDNEAVLSKGFYRRPVDTIEGSPTQDTGGRVTELVARPLIALLFPALGDVIQPLSGEFAVRRRAIETVAFARGYAVDLALLIDVVAAFGRRSLIQVDLGERRHDRQPLLALGAQATVITAMALRRAGVERSTSHVLLHQPLRDAVELDLGELPTVRGYRSGLPEAGEPGRPNTQQSAPTV